MDEQGGTGPGGAASGDADASAEVSPEALAEREVIVEPGQPADREHKPMMTTTQILLMNLGFFGIQYSFGMQQTAVNPVYQYLGADPDSLPLLNLAGPVTGLLIQPMIGALSDRTWSDRWGRRKPFFLIGAIGCSICLFLFPFVAAVWMAVLLLWLLDASNNTAMEPYRAFIADKLPSSQLAKGFLAQSFFTGLGITLANFSLSIFKAVLDGATDAGIPYWVFGAFMLGSVCSIASVLVSVLTTKELPPTPAERAELEAAKAGSHGLRAVGQFLAAIWSAIREMPVGLRKLALVYLFQWYAMNVYWQYIALSVGVSSFGLDLSDSDYASTAAYDSGVALAGRLNGTYNIVTFLVAFALAALARRYGAKWVHAVCLWCATVGLLILPHMTSTIPMYASMIGLGIAWASIMGVPYIMAVRMIPREKYGVYMGIINMMIVVPQLLQTLTFGTVYKHLLGEDPQNAIMLAGVLLGLGGIAMLWIREPRPELAPKPIAA